MITLDHVTKKYNIGKPNELTVLDNITLTIQQGEMVAIMGRSGAGKSTLMHIIGALEEVTSGSYYLDNKEIGSLSDSALAKIRNREVGILLQDFALLNTETALNNCMVPLYFSSAPFAKMRKQAMSALNTIGIANLSKQIVGTMSGGQKQRVALARAIVCNPRIVLADEPTGALDSLTASEVICELKKCNERGVTVIIVTHDHIIAEQCDRIIYINDGKLSDADPFSI